MITALDKFINQNESGLYLLDSPTGFGKTYSVINILKDYLAGNKFQNIDRMCFVTNLKTNIVDDELMNQLTDEEKKFCVRIRSYEEDVVENWCKDNIPKVLHKSKELISLNTDIEALADLMSERSKLISEGTSVEKKNNIIASFRRKIATITEPAFRKFLYKTYFLDRSTIFKKNFIRENKWFTELYPISTIDSMKVIFFTTAKFISPINMFHRMPFSIYEDAFLENSVVFIDEFDSSKEDLLKKIIEQSVKINIDIIDLFTSIHYVLEKVEFPTVLMACADCLSEDKTNILSTEKILELNKEKFKKIYDANDLKYLLKSKDFNDQRAFIFDDGYSIAVNTDSSKKGLDVQFNSADRVLDLLSNTKSKVINPLNNIINEVYDCVLYFVNGVRFIANNYNHYKNTTSDGRKIYKCTQDEALMTVLNSFKLGEANNKYVLSMIKDGVVSIVKNEQLTRKGFRFVEIEDADDHRLHSVAHQFNFVTTPENIIILLSQISRVVGISATATLPTVVGNYDLDYIASILGDNYIEISSDCKTRIDNRFNDTQKDYDKVKINVNIIDDFDCFTDKEISEKFLSTIYNGEILEKYLAKMRSTDNMYDLLRYIKTVYLYKEVAMSDIRSFICFQNKLPVVKDEHFDYNILLEMFNDAAACNGFDMYDSYVVKSSNYDEEFIKIYSELAKGKKCFVISTYKTIGSGKNIQYKIPSMLEDNMIICDIEKMYKDFDGIYVCTPTNLIQRVSSEGEDRYEKLTKYLYQQQCLRLNKILTYSHYRENVIAGFRRSILKQSYAQSYNKNSDICLHTAQIIIQAIGRICRCRNKNKNIHIYSETAIVDRLNRVKPEITSRLLNTELMALLNVKIKNKKISSVNEYSLQSKAANRIINTQAKIVRSSKLRVSEWKDLRDYVLKNPTADAIEDRFRDLYFEFDASHSAYSYEVDNKFNIINMSFDSVLNMLQVSDLDSELPILLKEPCIANLFNTQKYAKKWKNNKCIMTPSLYNQIYKGALGEVVGKAILEEYLGCDVDEIEEHSLYEFFDYKIKNLYIDFKHWKSFQADPFDQIRKIKWKLNRAKGEKAVIINIVKRGEHLPKISWDEDVIVIPYLIDPETGDVSDQMIKIINDAINS